MLGRQRSRAPSATRSGSVRRWLLLAFLCGLGGLLGAVRDGAWPAAAAAKSTQVLFFSNNALPIGPKNPLVSRPSGFALFLDGKWGLEHLRWSGWGTAVARATGTSTSSNDNPGAASGSRINTWADMTLSDPVRWRGHQVYSCFKVLVPPPAGDLSGCVLPHPPVGNGWMLSGGDDQVEFLSPGQNIWCTIVPNVEADCVGGPGHPGALGSTPPTLGASLEPNGKLTFCRATQPKLDGGCAQNWDPTPPVLAVGQRVQAGSLLCTSLRRGIRCMIASGAHRGAGFLINTNAVQNLR
jgi:hypothetical protein